MQSVKYLNNVTTLRLDQDKCSGCTLCTIVCPHAVFAMIDKKAAIIDLDACMECGACAVNCADEAIYVESGVGCANGIILGATKGTEPSCCESSDDQSCC